MQWLSVDAIVSVVLLGGSLEGDDDRISVHTFIYPTLVRTSICPPPGSKWAANHGWTYARRDILPYALQDKPFDMNMKAGLDRLLVLAFLLSLVDALVMDDAMVVVVVEVVQIALW